ncbi:MAG: LexA family protein [Aminipila sp.]
MNDREQAVYDFIITFFKENGYAPAFNEISKGADIKSKSSVFKILRNLKKVNLVDFIEGKARTIKVIGYHFAADVNDDDRFWITPEGYAAMENMKLGRNT